LYYGLENKRHLEKRLDNMTVTAPVFSTPTPIPTTMPSAVNKPEDFAAVHGEIEARSAARLTVLARRRANSPKLALYPDVEATIWRVWQVLPTDVTINHVRHAQCLLTRNSEGGVELDRISSEAYGIDYDRLMLRMRASLVNADWGEERVPRKSVPGASASPTVSEGLKSLTNEADHDRSRETDGVTPPRKKRGRPAKIGIAEKEAALAAKAADMTWNEVAQILYKCRYATPQQKKNAANILKHYERTRTPSPNES